MMLQLLLTLMIWTSAGLIGFGTDSVAVGIGTLIGIYAICGAMGTLRNELIAAIKESLANQKNSSETE